MLIEQEYFQFITEGVQPVADGSDRICYTEARDHFIGRAFRNFSIKMPLQGSVLYETANKAFSIEPGNYLLAVEQPGKMIIDSDEICRCICIDLSRNTIAGAIAALEVAGKLGAGQLTVAHFFSGDFFEQVCPVRGNDMGAALGNLAGNLLNNNISVSQSTFDNLARELVLQESANMDCLQRLKAQRQETKKDLLRRLWKARYYMDEQYLRNPPIPEVAAYCNISGFYFFRSFKQAFAITPYEYMMSKRLTHAQQLVLNNVSITTIAGLCGFSDVFTFSKAFKKWSGISPSGFRMSYARDAG